MTPQDFLNKWKIKRSQLSLLLGVAQGTVDHWFAKSAREPPPEILKRLDEYDALLEYHQSSLEFLEERFPVLYEILKRQLDEN